MANADVRLGIRKNARRRDGTPKRRLDRAAQRWFSPRNTSAKMTLLDRFRGEGGRRLCVEALAAQRLVSGNRELAEDLANRAEVLGRSNADLPRSRRQRHILHTGWNF